jgi:hypothetical protein
LFFDADINADAGKRLWDLLEYKNVVYRDRFKQSVDTAGKQLELLKTNVLDNRPGGGYAGPAVMYPPGTVPIVLAYRTKVFAVRSVPTAGYTFSGSVERALRYIQKTRNELRPEINVLIETVIESHGRTPDGESPDMPYEQQLLILGYLFTLVSEEAKVGLVSAIEGISSCGICPVLIGLLEVGGGTGIWPLMMELAPYADAVMEG